MRLQAGILSSNIFRSLLPHTSPLLGCVQCWCYRGARNLLKAIYTALERLKSEAEQTCAFRINI